MTVAAIITRAGTLANLSGASIFSSAEGEYALNAAYRDIYEEILQAEDDYFLTSVSFLLSALTAVTDDQNAYLYTLPTVASPFYRLRTLEYLAGTTWRPIRKQALLDEEKRAFAPSYRFQGLYLYLYLPGSGNYNKFRMTYYPAPSNYPVAPGTADIAFPPQLEPDILAYQIAIDMKRKQDADYTKLLQRRDELFRRFLMGIAHRDDAGTGHVANVYDIQGGD
jgi:hypothetical protein